MDITKRNGVGARCCNFAAQAALAGLIVAGLLFVGGCSAPKEPEPQAADEARAPDRHAEEEAASPNEAEKEPADEAEGALARAESRVEPEVSKAQPAQRAEQPAAQKPVKEMPAELEPPAPITAAEAPLPMDDVPTEDLTMPTVSLTEQHAAMCKVRVGDKFPELKLPAPGDGEKALADLQGQKLTLVVFWNDTQPNALEELSDLARYYQPRFGDEGLSIVAINSGDDAQLAGELAKKAGASYPLLSDADKQAFAQVATAKLPRTYLLDPSGQILWFDLEYSPTTRRDLARAIRYQLAH